MAFMLPTGKDWKSKRTTKGAQMLLADMAGNAADLIFLRYQEKIDKAVPFVKSTFKSIMYTPVKLMQGPLEWAMGHLSGIEGEASKQERLQQDSETRLQGILETGYHYLSAGLVGYAALIGTEKMLSKKMGTGHVPNKMWWHLDAPVHIGCMLLLSSRTAQPVTNTAKEMLKKVMTGAGGWTEEKAEQDSRFIMAYIVPNYLTLIPTVGMMGGLYKAQEKGIIRPTHEESWTNKVTNGWASKVTGGLLGDDTHGFEVMHKNQSLKGEGMWMNSAKFLRILGDPTNAKTAAH